MRTLFYVDFSPINQVNEIWNKNARTNVSRICFPFVQQGRADNNRLMHKTLPATDRCKHFLLLWNAPDEASKPRTIVIVH